jgi:DNA-binding IclR family transcriptional regulator
MSEAGKPILSEEEDPHFVMALARGLEILRCFNHERPELGTRDIARLTNLPQPTVWRLCYTLTRLGYLEQTKAAKLRVGPSVLTLGYSTTSSMDILEVARPRMEALAEELQAVIVLGTRDRLDMLFLHRCHARDATFVLNRQTGMLVPMGHSSMGWTYLASLEDEKRNALLKEIERNDPVKWVNYRPMIEGAVLEYKQNGFVTNIGTLHTDLNTVAVPVLVDGNADYIFTCGGHAAYFTREVLSTKIVPRLSKLVAEIEPFARAWRQNAR